MTLPDDLGAQIAAFVTEHPGATAVQVAHNFKLAINHASELLMDLVDLKKICSAIARGEDGTATVYRAVGAELPSLFEKALATADAAAGGQPQTAEQKAIAFITANGGSATSDELAHVLGLKPGQFPSTWLSGALKKGVLSKNSRAWTLGVGAHVAPMKPLVFNPAISTRHPVDVPVFVAPAVVEPVPVEEAPPRTVKSDDDYRRDYKDITGRDFPTDWVSPTPSPEPDLSPLRIGDASFAVWSNGELHIADGGRTVATLSREQVGAMIQYFANFDTDMWEKK